MTHLIVGLGNPGTEYEHTRHNVGRMVVEHLASTIGASEWRTDKKLHARIATGTTPSGTRVTLVLPDNYMNRSGGSVAPLVTNTRQREHLVVVHDDIDLPVGTLRIVFDRGAGGHNGVLSIERALRSRAFCRVRVGVVPTTPAGKLKKPSGEAAIHDLILKPLTPAQQRVVATAVERASAATLAVVDAGRDAAMRDFNGARP